MTTTCACKIKVEAQNGVSSGKLTFCPLHAAAEDMAKALTNLTALVESKAPVSALHWPVVKDARAALAKAGR